jgi:ubiquinone/menaquinone biosynthesis C-methylase UbiE
MGKVLTKERGGLFIVCFFRPFQSPLHPNSKKHVLHIGCGDGSWCIETATMFPNWLVVGMDDKTGGFSPDQRKVPKNFKYIRNCDDILRTIRGLPSDSFDFVHSRFLTDVYGDNDYMEFIKECKRICKPKGYLELYELDMRIYGNPRAGATTHKLNAIGNVIRESEKERLTLCSFSCNGRERVESKVG